MQKDKIIRLSAKAYKKLEELREANDLPSLKQTAGYVINVAHQKIKTEK